MNKDLKIGSMKLSIPEHSAEIGRSLERLQNEYEAGNMKALLCIYAIKDGVAVVMAGDKMIMPFVAIAANAVSEGIIENIAEAFLAPDEEED